MTQHTIKKSVACSGIGLHSGRKVRLGLRPAPENTGIIFSFQDGSGKRFLKPNPASVVATGLATTLGDGKVSVSTVEHLLAAVRGMGIDNIHVEVEGGELPIMDGSAAPFAYLLKLAGLRPQRSSRAVLALKKPLEFVRDGKWVKARPADGFRVDYTIDFPHPLIGRQRLVLDVTPESFQQVSRARTFGFLREVEYLRKNGLALGGSLDNAVVLDEYGIVNEGGLRFPDEFVRHKLLDFIGDMAVSELPLHGHFEVHASGHALNNEFLRYLTENADDYLERVVLEEPEAASAGAMGRAKPVSEGRAAWATV